MTSGYHEYNGKIYEPVNEFHNQNLNNSYNNQNNFDNYKSHNMRNSYAGPGDYSTSYYGNNYSKSHKAHHRNNLVHKNLEEENAHLKKELHELRKLESGWFGKNKNYVKKEVIVKNNHYLDEKEKITSEVTNMRERHTHLEREKLTLIQKLRDLEARLAN